MNNNIIIAIDGFAGSGKSSVSFALAKKFNMLYLDTGAIYRAVALASLKMNIDSHDICNLIRLINNININFKNHINYQQVFLNSNDVTYEIRTEKISQLSSIISRHHDVRKKLYFLQKKFSKNAKQGLIAEGRDIGTIIFPKAKLKIFLKASKKERANRRIIQLGESMNKNIEDVLSNILLRDNRDLSREISPLIPAYDAIIIDTTNSSLKKIVNIIELFIIKIFNFIKK